MATMFPSNIRETGSELLTFVNLYDTNPNAVDTISPSDVEFDGCFFLLMWAEKRIHPAHVSKENKPANSSSKSEIQFRERGYVSTIGRGSTDSSCSSYQTHRPVKKRRGLEKLFGENEGAPTAASAKLAIPKWDWKTQHSFQTGSRRVLSFSLSLCGSEQVWCGDSSNRSCGDFSGVCITLLMVFVCRRALPGLQMSVTAGLLFFSSFSIRKATILLCIE